jgi:hypothetical protein
MSYLEEILEQLKKEGHFDHFEANQNKYKAIIAEEVSEILKIIEKFDLNFNLGTAVKQILCSYIKSEKIDRLKIAVEYIEREIEKLEKD